MLKLSVALAALTGLITDKELMKKVIVAIVVPGGLTIMAAYWVWTQFAPTRMQQVISNLYNRVALSYARLTT